MHNVVSIIIFKYIDILFKITQLAGAVEYIE